MSTLLWWCDFTYTICRVTLPTERVSWNWITLDVYYARFCHAPHGACELKWFHHLTQISVCRSRSPRSVWVEIGIAQVKWNQHCKSRSPRSVWVEIQSSTEICQLLQSRSPRSVWVEMLCPKIYCQPYQSRSPRSVWVEIISPAFGTLKLKSRSPRSVWVEICKLSYCFRYNPVTLPTERVSWNIGNIKRSFQDWVTLPTERVSWNNNHVKFEKIIDSHAPHGACELKLWIVQN